MWLKATGPEVAFEVGLYELLVRVAPERVLTPLATDAARGWLLLPDGGPTLADRGIDIAAALPVYARLQLDLAPHVEELLALGVADMRPAAMPARFDEALAAIGGDDRLAALRPAVAEWCERLVASPVPASIDHNDFHGFNILAGERFYDWGDAVVAHPFASMLALEWVDTDEAGRARRGTPTWSPSRISRRTRSRRDADARAPRRPDRAGARVAARDPGVRC